ncbi:MAG: phosphomannose isomerase type II C-terminal cupin domain [Alphaproteobacteria bacterium]|nr:phosphomannose isomerase type II C-terminal cupin domain [Alphaproteobacteria bacterium]
MKTNNYKSGDFDTRPWGQWAVLEAGDSFIVKRITVNPGGRLSLQYHNHKDEVWIIAGGCGEVQTGQDKRNVKTGDVVTIPKQTPHRIFNNGNEPLIIIETQTGAFLDEGDIVRLQDDYGRAG